MEGMKLYVSFSIPFNSNYAEQVNDGSYLEAIKAKIQCRSPWFGVNADINKEIEGFVVNIGICCKAAHLLDPRTQPLI